MAKPEDFLQNMHRMCEIFLNYMGTWPIEEMTIETRFFDQLSEHARTRTLFLHVPGDRIPIEQMTINIQGRPVLIKRALRKTP